MHTHQATHTHRMDKVENVILGTGINYLVFVAVLSLCVYVKRTRMKRKQREEEEKKHKRTDWIRHFK